jgi:hypothetical protein
VATHRVTLPACALSNNCPTIPRCKVRGVCDEYYSVKKFRNAYKRLVVTLGDNSFWPEVDIGVPVGAPLVKRPVGQQRKKNRIKSYIEGGSGSRKKKGGKEKSKKLF